MPKIALIGPLSKDRVIKENMMHKSAGGPVYYQSSVMKSLKINVSALITLSKSDKTLLKEFGKNIEIIPSFRNKTIEFQNIYPTDDPDFRIQKANIPCNPITVEDMMDFNLEDVEVILLGPLCPYDIPLETIEFLSKFNIPLYLGAQGYLRHLKGDEIVLSPWNDFKKFLKFIKILFLDENEAKIILDEDISLTETAKILASFGPEEVIITCGSHGAVIYSKKLDKTYKIPAFKADHVVDPTGLGDMFMAAYSVRKLEIEDPEECGIFAAAAAAIKLEKNGPFRENRDLIEEKMKIS